MSDSVQFFLFIWGFPLLVFALALFMVGMAVYAIRHKPSRGTFPITDHVLIRPIEAPTHVGALELSQTNEIRPSDGVVLAVGPGKRSELGLRIKPEVRVGDLVSFPDYAGHKMQLTFMGKTETLLLARQDELALNHGPYQPEPLPIAKC